MFNLCTFVVTLLLIEEKLEEADIFSIGAQI